MRWAGDETKRVAAVRTCHRGRASVRTQAGQVSIAGEEVGAALTTLANNAAT